MASSPSSGFRPIHIDREGIFDLPVERDRALGYLSPEGERAWVPGWDPVYLHRTERTAGSVFRTTHNTQETVWLVLEYSPSEGRATYVRASEGSHLGTVRVECVELAEAMTRVRVAYSLTSTTPAGTRLLEAMHEAAYAAMLIEWRRLILETLAAGQGRP